MPRTPQQRPPEPLHTVAKLPLPANPHGGPSLPAIARRGASLAPSSTARLLCPDSQVLWACLLSYKEQGFPMGCATAEDPFLKEMGLVGMHAYSVLDVRDIRDPRARADRQRPDFNWYGAAPEPDVVRLLRIRNPHGVGEWTGDWGDHSAKWTGHLADQLGRTGVNDGTFWMDYSSFLLAFQVWVCRAPPPPRRLNLSALMKGELGWRLIGCRFATEHN